VSVADGLGPEQSDPTAEQESAEGEVGRWTGEANEALRGRKVQERIGRAAMPPPKARTIIG
jgi:hypothetical protein